MKLTYAIDFGSSNITIYQKDYCIVLKEPSLVQEIQNKNGVSYGKVGFEAEEMIGKTDYETQIISPIQNGEVYNKEAFTHLFLNLFEKVKTSYSVKPQIEFFVLASCGLGSKDYNDIREVCYMAGADVVNFVPTQIASLIGVGVDISELKYYLSIDIGGDTVTVSIIGNSKIVKSVSVNIGGNKLNEEINEKIKELGLDFDLDLLTLEKIKKEVCSLYPKDNAERNITYFDNNLKGFASKKINSQKLYCVVEKYFDLYCQLVESVLEDCDLTIKSLVYNNKIIVYGGFSKLKGVKEYLEKRLNMPVYLDESENTSINGLIKIINDKKFCKQILNIL